MEDKLLELNIGLIDPNPDQPRTEFDQAELQSLAQSIKEHGLVQPVTVRISKVDEGRFYLIDGERRWRATKLAGLSTIKAYCKESIPEKKESLIGAVIASSQRSDLNPIDEAVSFQRLIRTGGYTQKRVAELVGRSISYVNMRLKLLEFDDEIQGFFAKRKLTVDPGLVCAIDKLPEEIRASTLRRFVQRGTSVAYMRRIITMITNRSGNEGVDLTHSRKAPAIAMGMKEDTKKPAQTKIVSVLEKRGEMPQWKLIEEAAKAACEECGLADLASSESCKECPAVDLIKHLNRLAKA